MCAMKLLTELRANVSMYKDWIVSWRAMPVRSWMRAAQAYRSGNFEVAVELYRRGLKSNPSSPARVNALLDLSHCLFRLRRFEEAERSLRQASVAAPNEREVFVRLARLQLWLGHSSEAAWTVRSCLQKIPSDPELVALFINAAVESGGQPHLVQEAKSLLAGIHYEPEAFPRLEVARLRLELLLADSLEARDELAKLATADRGPFEAVVAFAQLLIREDKLAYARHHLHRALSVSPEHPRVLRLLAASYLQNGIFFEPEYAIQLATKACQATGWKGVNEMHTLAQAYVATGDKVSALLIASKARDTGKRLLGSFPDAIQLDQLIERLSTGTQA